MTVSGDSTIQAPELEFGWVDTYVYLRTTDGMVMVVDGECLLDDDYDILESVCPQCVEERFNERMPSESIQQEEHVDEYFL